MHIDQIKYDIYFYLDIRFTYVLYTFEIFNMFQKNPTYKNVTDATHIFLHIDLHSYEYKVCILITNQTTNAKEAGNRDMVDHNHNDDDDRRMNWIR